MREGQSLIEIVIAVAVGAILVVGAATIVSPVLKSSTEVKNAQTSAALGKELLENVRSFAEGSWHNIDFLATSSANKYWLIASTSPFTATTTGGGIETVTISSSSYTRYFYLDDVYRAGDTGTKIVSSGGTLDPSTKKLTVVYTWGQTKGQNTLVTYLTRFKTNIWWQTDWSGGANVAGPVTTSSGNQFATSSGVNFNNPGTICITGLC